MEVAREIVGTTDDPAARIAMARERFASPAIQRA
jgi:hypothetical protein